GMLVGAVTVLVWQHYHWFKLYEMVPGFALATLAIVVASLLDRPPSTRQLSLHAEVEREIATHGG
ncbi:MAG: sodium:proline symporter, partial [Comamonas sp.]